VFLIWSLIYLALIIFAVYIVTKRGLVNEKIDTITWWFVASIIFNAAWVIFWHYEQFPITMVVMVGLLISLIVIYLKLGIGKKERKLVEKLVVATPFSIYLGWITVATIANAGNLLYVLGWRGGQFLSHPGRSS
jgi:tryptophan-rich sensory protein